MMKTLIVGAGYAGLNAYYSLNKNAQILSDKDYFLFYTAYLRAMLNLSRGKYTANLNFVTLGKVIEYDLDQKWVKTKEGKEFNPDNLVLAVGCDRSGQLSFIDKILSKEKISISVETSQEDYLAVQLAFYLRNRGKNVSYCGNALQDLGERVSNAIMESMQEKGIRIEEKCEDIIPECRPPYPFDFFDVDPFLRYKGVYVIGDLIKGYPKVGELAMRTGIYVAKYIKKETVDPFTPIFINIIDTGDYALHIRSNKLWGGNIEVVKRSKVRSLMKRFIERYYIFRKGKMGLLYYL
ncbi:pyridine nucleotide-disulfide oxidoreductase [Stygiolobus caldivivus]|uniref:Uncharacterized protein n=1 Tax=Stygiolobus caldivivus TaxID=2824673 RepID=A0A8D5U7Q4_9CREN|nr:pyridine nucleotide-disulfide oxidoreductase [Stygiolobus caldivivus]BCU71290.1 hypothetical protein KN1_25870 [Stygiolobus caldivivus]